MRNDVYERLVQEYFDYLDRCTNLQESLRVREEENKELLEVVEIQGEEARKYQQQIFELKEKINDLG